MSDLWDSWLLVALLAPCIWALVSVIDLYLVQGLYQDEWDGALISGAFQGLPWLLVVAGFISFSMPSASAVGLALAGGFTFLCSFFFYFRALFRFADAPLIHVLWNVAVLLVPFLTWVWANERLQPTHYAGLALAFVGSSVFVVRKGVLRDGFRRVAAVMVWAVLLLSVSMVLQKQAYEHASGRFLDVFLVFSLGVAAAAAVLSTLGPRGTVMRLRRFASLDGRFIVLFAFAEVVSVAGTLFSQRAIDLAPSVSFVAAIESTMPAFVMLLSLCFATVLSRRGNAVASVVFRNQVRDWRTKLLAIALMSSGVYCIAR